ncbi:uncharacterized protein EV154DRAFT_556975 [Mucor mucedo]|uniref:uncharacterized protein n=1 Tax=Mucor mucedo TaxID=29922 RepID=UPI00221F74DF|nr:uncharacterized protein EV154DRAFT_556975 [Mucor mucedo]KAI7867480.1 hypothetical protein EV154DRAFT_556975 [Mucor mucedo]
MEASLIRRLLPEEIMNLIFVYLEREIDIRNCRLVCLNWNSSIYSIFYKEGIQISLCKRNYQRLQDDIVKFPELKLKIQKLYIISEDEDRTGYNIDLNTFMPIINMCSNLKRLHFQATTSGDNFLIPLLTETVDLPFIEEIVADELTDLKRLTRETYLMINFKYRNTITSLRISDYDQDETYWNLKNYSDNEGRDPQRSNSVTSRQNTNSVTYERAWDTYPGLLNYVYNFRNLKVLKLLLTGMRDIIDISTLTESNLIQLKTLHICGEDSILFIENTPSHWSRLNSCGSVTELTLRALTISVNTLEYIMTYFDNVDRLNLYQTHPLKNYCNSSYDEKVTPTLIEKLKSYCTGKEDVHVFFKYDTIGGQENFKKQVLIKGGKLIDEIRQPEFDTYWNDYYDSGPEYYDIEQEYYDIGQEYYDSEEEYYDSDQAHYDSDQAHYDSEQEHYVNDNTDVNYIEWHNSDNC